MNRQEDLTKVFDKTWQANHNDVAKRGREREKEFMDKMFNVKKEDNKKEIITPGMQAHKLQNDINKANNYQKNVMLNNIIKKWK